MERESAIPTVLPPMGNMTPEQTATASLTHWVWTAFKNINNMGPIEIYSQIGYREHRWTELKRCIPYPLGNLTSYEPDRSAAEGTTGYNLNSDALPKIKYEKTAQAQAAELGNKYGDSGFRILLPLLGMDDAERVNQIIQVVQPFEYDIHEMRYEFSVGAEERIKESNLSDEDKKKARDIAKIMLNGAALAEKAALREYEALISSMSDKMAGGPGIANPSNAFQSHVWICEQLKKPVPARIDRTGGQGNNSAAIDILAKRALKEESAAEAMTAQAESLAAQLEREKAAREGLEARLAALESGNPKPTRQPRA